MCQGLMYLIFTTHILHFPGRVNNSNTHMHSIHALHAASAAQASCSALPGARKHTEAYLRVGRACEGVSGSSPPPMSSMPPTAVRPLMALVTLMSGECSAGVTPHTVWYPQMDARPNLATMLLNVLPGEAAPSASSPASPAAVPVAAERVCARSNPNQQPYSATLIKDPPARPPCPLPQSASALPAKTGTCPIIPKPQ